MADRPFLAAALRYAEMFGWPVIPLHTPRSYDRCSCGTACGASNGKHPRTAHGLTDATTDAHQIREWGATFPDANVGLVMGVAAGVVAADEDGPKGAEALLALCGNPPTVTNLTARGRHLLFAHPGRPVPPKVRLAPDLDIRGDGSYIVAPPSFHRTGIRYRWDRENGLGPRDCDPAPFPPALLARLAPSAVQPAATIGPIPEGERNASLCRLGGAMRRYGCATSTILEALTAENDLRCQPPLAHGELERIAASVGRYPAAHSPTRPKADDRWAPRW